MLPATPHSSFTARNRRRLSSASAAASSSRPRSVPRPCEVSQDPCLAPLVVAVAVGPERRLVESFGALDVTGGGGHEPGDVERQRRCREVVELRDLHRLAAECGRVGFVARDPRQVRGGRQGRDALVGGEGRRAREAARSGRGPHGSVRAGTSTTRATRPSRWASAVSPSANAQSRPARRLSSSRSSDDKRVALARTAETRARRARPGLAPHVA